MSALLTGCSLSSEVVELGDLVTLNYVGKLEDGKVFDTSLRDVAENPLIQKAGFFVPKRSYTPFTFKVGMGSVIAGFEEGVLGMKIDESKEVVIPPEKGYGLRDETLVEIRPRTFLIDVVESVPKIDIVEETGLTEFEMNQSIEWRDWRARIIAVTNDSVILKNEVTETVINTEIGTIQVKVETGTITQTFTPDPDKVITSDAGSARLSIINDTHFMVDYNHPLAGRTLTFEITLVSIEKADK